MIIKSITLNNYRLYEGENRITFDYIPGKNVHLVCGENGYGKTTFLHSLLWCLYGKLFSDVPASGADSNNNYTTLLKNNLNINATKRCEDSITSDIKSYIKRNGYTYRYEHLKKNTVYSVSILFTDLTIPAIPCRTIEITRSYDYILQKEDVSIMIDGKKNELTNEIGPDVFINDFILNKDIARLFFFDSEEVVELAETRTISERRKLSQAYEEVLGIRKYERLKSSLEILKIKYRKKSKDLGLKKEMERLLEEKTYIENQSSAIEQEIAQLSETINQFREEDTQLQLQLSLEGSTIKSDELNRVKQAIETCKKNDAEMKNKLKQFIEYAPFAIAGNVFYEGYLFAKHNHEIITQKNASVTQNAVLDSLSNELTMYLSNLPVDSQKKLTAIENINAIINRYRGEKSDREISMVVSDEVFSEIESIYNSLKNTYKIEFENLAQSYKKNRIALDKNIKRLSNINSKENNEVIKNIRLKKNNIENQIAESEKKMRQCHEKVGEYNSILITLGKEIREISKRVNVDEADEKKDKLASKLVEDLDSFLCSLKQNKKTLLERRIRNTLNSLMHKEDFIGRVEVKFDSDAMDILLYTPKDDLIDKDTLSKGEKQLYATSLLKSLVDESGIQFPVFIDSPLQKFDKSHSSKIISDLYPTISKQVVLFPLLHKELTKSELGMLIKHIGSSTLIVNDTTRSGFEKVDASTLLDD